MTPATFPAMPDRPNVLVIMTDEERYDDVRHTPRHVNPG